MRTQLLVAQYLKENGWPFAESVGPGRSGADILGTPDVCIEVLAAKSAVCDNGSGPRGVGSTAEGLTHSPDLSREGLAMKATRKPIDPATLTERVMQRIWAKTCITEAGCIEWTGARSSNGYGRVGFRRGHDLTAPNAWACSNGGKSRMCRLCRNESARARRVVTA